MTDEKVVIIAGEGAVGAAPAVFSSVGLGSCVAVTLYDTKRRIGGLVHIMLPGNRRGKTAPPGGGTEGGTEKEKRDRVGNMSIVPASKRSYCLGGPAERGERSPMAGTYHYADTAIAALLREMANRGALIPDIVAKVAGGAKMFADGEEDERSIGGRNAESVRRLLKREKIPVIGEDTGGSHGRNIDFHLDSGRVIIRTIGGVDREI